MAPLLASPSSFPAANSPAPRLLPDKADLQSTAFKTVGRRLSETIEAHRRQGMVGGDTVRRHHRDEEAHLGGMILRLDATILPREDTIPHQEDTIPYQEDTTLRLGGTIPHPDAMEVDQDLERITIVPVLAQGLDRRSH